MIKKYETLSVYILHFTLCYQPKILVNFIKLAHPPLILQKNKNKIQKEDREWIIINLNLKDKIHQVGALLFSSMENSAKRENCDGRAR